MASNQPPSSANRPRLAPPVTTPRAAATPNRPAISAEPISGRLSASARRTTAATPHARAAIRALDQRRTALFTPGRARRRSLRDQRETPRDVLRNLSRVLAPSTTAVASSSSPGVGNSTLPTINETRLGDEDDDDFPIERPRFSLPLAEDDDDSDLKPPRSSGLEDENYTATSIELPRRAWSETPLSRLDRGSFGSVRFSDYIGPEFGSDDAGIDSGFFPPPELDDDTGGVVLDETGVIERVDVEDTRRQTLARESLFGPIQIPETGNESTFVMAPLDSPARDPTILEEIIEDDMPGIDDDDRADEGLDMEEQDDDDEELDETLMARTADIAAARKLPRRKKTGKKISRYGIEYPSLPQGVVKKLAMNFARTAGVGKAKISSDTLNSIMQASDWFFEQLGDDLQAYAKHAGRKTIDESDMITLMRRQRQTSASTTPFALAQRHLPRELLQELRMPAPAPIKGPRRKARRVQADEEEEVG